jgi:hypothetical protein
LYEEGRLEAAEKEKLRLEQKQRELRKLLESQGKPWSPQYFELRDDADSETGKSYYFKDNYWQNRGLALNELDIF